MVVDYNVRIPGGGLNGLKEIDVVGYDFSNRTVYLCEVITHLSGVLYGTYENTMEKVARKLIAMQTYSSEHLCDFEIKKYMLWAPRVAAGLHTQLQEVDGLELIVNSTYTSCINELNEFASHNVHETGNPFLRALQILQT